MKELKSIFGLRMDFSKTVFKNMQTKVVATCPEHGDKSYYPQNLLRGHGCRECGNSTTAGKNKLAVKEILQRVNGLSPELTINLDEYVNQNSRIPTTCECGHMWSPVLASLLRGHGCPVCGKESFGEREISKTLERMQLDFIREWRHPDCKHIRSLPFDFFIPTLKTLIEFDGCQHYLPSNGWFCPQTQVRDNIKTAWAADNGFRLIRFRQVEAVNSLERILK